MTGKKRDWVSLEQALDLALLEGRENDFLPLLNALPLEKKEKYRELWKKRKNQSPPVIQVCSHGVSLQYRCWDCDPEEDRHD